MEIQATTYPDAGLSAVRNAAPELADTAHVVKTIDVEEAAETPVESAIVEISDAGRKIGEADEAVAEQTGTVAAKSESSTKESLHHAQAFVYGALGMEHPDDTSRPKDSFYTAGKWLAAAATVGTIVSLLA